jgi:SPP1 family predicted phage head-tail adaptor
MADYKPNLPFNVPAMLLKRSLKKVNGTNQESFTEKTMFFCSAKSYGGTEKQVNGVTVIEDTWTIDTWYNPDFRKGDKIRFLDDGTEYEILASPENINRRGQYMRFKAVGIGG